ncbi:hypothetical protein [Peribacillus asahii]|uniref:hypothetical protein n=1 Tax=Peribacillus asahii TaxID=228899 RepID=UPI00207AEDA9|nr:hypothetical protein [Peribacillus asahii]USK84788.1 hypothetical protein LIT35_20755 [Peribacillus asahii]
MSTNNEEIKQLISVLDNKINYVQESIKQEKAQLKDLKYLRNQAEKIEEEKSKKIKWMSWGEIDHERRVRYEHTFLSWYNVYHIQTGVMVNLSPEEFAEIIPDVSEKVRMGCREITTEQKIQLFEKAETNIFNVVQRLEKLKRPSMQQH